MRARFRSNVALAKRLQRSADSRRVCVSVMTVRLSPFPTIRRAANAFRRTPDIRSAAMQRTDQDRYVALQTIFWMRENESETAMSHYEHCPVPGDLRCESGAPALRHAEKITPPEHAFGRRGGQAVADQPPSCRAVNPCATISASGQPSRQEASSASARSRSALRRRRLTIIRHRGRSTKRPERAAIARPCVGATLLLLARSLRA